MAYGQVYRQIPSPVPRTFKINVPHKSNKEEQVWAGVFKKGQKQKLAAWWGALLHQWGSGGWEAPRFFPPVPLLII